MQLDWMNLFNFHSAVFIFAVFISLSAFVPAEFSCFHNHQCNLFPLYLQPPNRTK